MVQIYKVGGSVRNKFLGLADNDSDFVAIGKGADRDLLIGLGLTEQTSNRRPGHSVFHKDGDEYTISQWSSIYEDLCHRDFTINALAEDEHGSIFCLPQTIEDLEQRQLRLAYVDAFIDDPIRIYRAGRFLATIPGLVATPDLIRSAKQHAHRLGSSAVSEERVRGELTKALGAGADSVKFFDFLKEIGALSYHFQELQQALEVPAGPNKFHGEASVYTHTMVVLQVLRQQSALTKWMGLCHDLGKLSTCPTKWPHHYGHDEAGAPFVHRLGLRLKLSRKWITAGVIGCAQHMRMKKYDELRPGKKVELLLLLHKKKLVNEMLNLVIADSGRDFRLVFVNDIDRAITKIKIDPAAIKGSPKAYELQQRIYGLLGRV
jgi:tRNA nucleotidyltransferase (CCA-adding enzyme)